MFTSQPNQNNNTNKPLFGNGTTINSSLFENKSQQQQPTSNLFGGQQNQQQQQQNTNPLFGGQNTMGTTQPQTNLFGPQNTTQPQQQQSQFNLFGPQSTSTQPQQSQSILFGPHSNFNQQPQTTFGSFGPQNTSTNLFGPQSTQQQNQNQPQHHTQNQIPINPFIYSQTKILSLMPSNQLKYEKINYLKSKDLKEVIKMVEDHFENNRLYLNNFESIFSKIQENFKLLQTESFKIAKFTKLMNSKSSKLKFILDNFNNDIRYQNEILNKNRDNLKIIEHHPSMKITVPSDYLDVMITEIQDFIQSQIDQISDLESLFELNYQKQSGNLHMNSDIIEQIIVSFYENLSGLTEETCRICEKVELIKQKYYIFLQRNLGWKDYEIENKFKENFNTKKNIDI